MHHTHKIAIDTELIDASKVSILNAEKAKLIDTSDAISIIDVSIPFTSIFAVSGMLRRMHPLAEGKGPQRLYAMIYRLSTSQITAFIRDLH